MKRYRFKILKKGSNKSFVALNVLLIVSIPYN